MVSTWRPERCGVGIFAENLVDSIGKVVNVKVAPIDNPLRNYTYQYPAINELKINKQDPNSWLRTANEISLACLENPNSAVILQHEYGLDPDKNLGPSSGRNFVKMSQLFNFNGIPHVFYLHTVNQKPNNHQRKVLQELADSSDGLIVTAQRAINLLRGSEYNISEAKIEHIDHGTRNFVAEGRDQVKERYGLEGVLVFTTLGMKGSRKGLEQTISAWGEFMQNKVTPVQRKNLVYIIAGGYHPNAITKEMDKEYNEKIDNEIKNHGLKSVLTKEHDELGKLARKNDIILLEPKTKQGSLDENIWTDLYTMTNCMVLWYPYLDQISSGILADTLGSGRASLTTKFLYALELLHPEVENKKGILGLNNSRSRGLSVDLGEEGIKQTVECFEHLTFDENMRRRMEEEAALRGSRMNWSFVGNHFLRYLEFIERMKEQKPGKDPIFRKE